MLTGLTMRWSERRTAVRSTFEMTSTLSLRATRALVRRRSSYSLGDEETGRTRQRVIDKTARPLQLLAILRVGQSHQALPRSGGLNRLYKGEFL